ncbi:dynamin family protein [Streptomyces mirabilis]|uniref:dynamin family protein n=1 Tax=Streptomyces mirabilis TaxID=68239 RepID=UPI0036DE0F33
MKAGKSTLINAIVGYQLLPARANPMTTLPTKIILVEGLSLDQPELTIPASTRSLYSTMEDSVRSAMRRGWTVPPKHGYLNGLAQDLECGTLRDLEPRYTGTTNVHRILARLNDEMRLATLAVESDFLGRVTELPELRAGHLHSFATGEIKGGQLVIIDTPGPNEHAIAARLGPALERQLANAHVLLAVLDYTQMGGDAAADIESRLARHVEIIGKERLYAVVNKVDARKSVDDLSAADTREIVRHGLGIEEKQIFEVAANWGLLGSRVLTEQCLQDREFQVARSPAAIAVLRELYPLDDETELNERLAGMEPEHLVGDASRFLKKSKILPLVETVINRLRNDAAPQVMGAGLQRYEAAMTELAGVIALKRSADERDAEEIEVQLATLGAEMEELQSHKERLPSVRALQERFHSKIDMFATELGSQGHQIIQMLQVEPPKTPKKQKGRIWALPLVHNMKTFIDNVFSDKPARDEYEFATLEEANQLKNVLAGAVSEQLRELLDLGRSELDAQVREISAAIVEEQERKVRGLIERAARTLSTAFDVDIKPPPPGITGHIKTDLGDPVTRMVENEEKYEVIEEQRIWWTLWLFTREVSVTRTRKVEVPMYVVSRESVMTQLQAAFDAQIAEVREVLQVYVAKQLTAELTAYYDGLQDYLQLYHDTLTRSLEGQRQDKERRREHGKALREIEQELTAELEAFRDYRLRLSPA